MDTYLGEETQTIPEPPPKSDIVQKMEEVKKSPSFLSRVANRFTESAGDVADTVKGIGGQFKEAFGETKDLLTNPESGQPALILQTRYALDTTPLNPENYARTMNVVYSNTSLAG